MSKTQQKKHRKHQATTLRQLAQLHRQRAACDTSLAALYETKAVTLANPPGKRVHSHPDPPLPNK